MTLDVLLRLLTVHVNDPLFRIGSYLWSGQPKLAPVSFHTVVKYHESHFYSIRKGHVDTPGLWWALLTSTHELCSDYCSKLIELRQFNLHLQERFRFLTNLLQLFSCNGTTAVVFVCLLACFGSDWLTVIWQTHMDGQTARKQSHMCVLIIWLIKHRRGMNQVLAPLLFLPSKDQEQGNLVQLPSIIEPLARVWLGGISCLMAAVCQSLLHMLTEDVRLLHADKSDSHAQAAFLFQRPGMVWRGCHRAWI